MILATGVAEGTGLYLVIADRSKTMIAVALLAGIFREVARGLYRRGLIETKAPAGTLAWFKSREERALTVARLASIICLAVALGNFAAGWTSELSVLGGLLAVLTGWGLKGTLITRAAFTRGHVIQHTPTRGRDQSHVVAPS
jgi:hypothetical protein